MSEFNIYLFLILLTDIPNIRKRVQQHMTIWRRKCNSKFKDAYETNWITATAAAAAEAEGQQEKKMKGDYWQTMCIWLENRCTIFERSANMLHSKKQNLMKYMFKQLCDYLGNIVRFSLYVCVFDVASELFCVSSIGYWHCVRFYFSLHLYNPEKKNFRWCEHIVRSTHNHKLVNFSGKNTINW